MIGGSLASSLHLQVYAFDRVKVETWWNFRGHISPFTRIFLIEDGEQEVTWNGQTHVCRPGFLYLIPPFVPVDYVCKGSCIQYYAIFTATVDDGNDLCSAFSFDYEQPADPLHDDLSQRLAETIPNFGLHTTDAYDPNFNLYIWQTHLEQLSASQVMVAQGVIRLLLAPFLASAQPQPQMLRFAKVLQFIDANLDKPISLDELAGQIKLDPTYFSDLFLKHFGIRPMEYLRRRRLDKAQALLITTNHTVAEIANLCGFADPNYFFRVFKQQFNATPSHFRR